MLNVQSGEQNIQIIQIVTVLLLWTIVLYYLCGIVKLSVGSNDQH